MDEPAGWSRADRDRFWSTVRGRMAELGLEQAELAEQLFMDRSNVTRRLQPGGVMTRPTSAEVDRLAEWLRVEPHQMQVLAGYAPQPLAVAPRRRRWWLVLALAASIVSVAIVLAVLGPGRGAPTARITEPADGAVLSAGPVSIRGIARGLGDGQRLWVFLRGRADGAYQPAAQSLPDAPAAEWTATAVVLGDVDVIVVLAGREADAAFGDWLARQRSGDTPTPLSSLPSDATALDTIHVSAMP